ncbi:DNA polymerase-4 [Dethiosulfatibacter aminovorans DSM 17477]|uniref:DNA polymerase IV n=1 Tax=Dethiosulfatibacter aminovorans DSM 17477 TaxID=1121476 RepID=A0A1M6BSK0_9FIRM|nr:DNA polymerase IV [Dethiosulfatibacter aminovorans]SHI51729.1 DNA polymerase-4 [Dethiosulfatibacter aminovorans DSM 17477]
MKKKILHVDLDAFFASVEQLDNPKLKGKPVIVGGTSKRGVVATCSYEARKYGVHSAMSSVMAHKLCPNGIFVRGHMERYKEISSQVFEILHEVTDSIQQMSIDEAYLDITDLDEDPHDIAVWIKEEVKNRIGITISIGISYNKFLAKLASDWNKPDGIFKITEEDIPDILIPLPVLKVHGLGKKTAAKLNNIGIFTIGDLLQYDIKSLSYIFGQSRAEEIYNRIRGIDNRSIKVTSIRKSYGRETTFSEDTKDREYIREVLDIYLLKITDRLKKSNKLAKTVTVKIKYEDFEQITRSHSLTSYTSSYDLFKEAMDLVLDGVELKKKVRLAGVSLSNISDSEHYQMSIFD